MQMAVIRLSQLGSARNVENFAEKSKCRVAERYQEQDAIAVPRLLFHWVSTFLITSLRATSHETVSIYLNVRRSFDFQ